MNVFINEWFIHYLINFYKGAAKLGLTVAAVFLRVVLESDGSEIDEDDMLVDLKGEVFLLLAPEELWSPGNMPIPHTDDDPVKKNVTPSCTPTKISTQTRPGPSRTLDVSASEGSEAMTSEPSSPTSTPSQPLTPKHNTGVFISIINTKKYLRCVN